MTDGSPEISIDLPSNVTLERDIPYREGAGKYWKLDLAMPKDPGGKLRPAIVVIHGGLIEGNKSRYTQFCTELATRGFIGAALNYRMAVYEPFPAAFEDCQWAVRWLRANAGKYHLDANRIGAIGFGTGGHLALMLGMAGEEAGLEGDGPHQEQSSRVQAVVSSCGPTDFELWTRHNPRKKGLISLFLPGPDATRAERYKKASPSNYIRQDTPPLLLIHGAQDKEIPVEVVDQFAEDLKSAGCEDVTYIRSESAGHSPYFLPDIENIDSTVEGFFARTLMHE